MLEKIGILGLIIGVLFLAPPRIFPLLALLAFTTGIFEIIWCFGASGFIPASLSLLLILALVGVIFLKMRMG